MHLMPDPVAAAIAPQPPPASDVLDLVMQGGQVFTVEPPAPFALIVAEAFDRGMPASDWTAWTGPAANPALRAALLQVWRANVWPRWRATPGAAAADRPATQ